MVLLHSHYYFRHILPPAIFFVVFIITDASIHWGGQGEGVPGAPRELQWRGNETRRCSGSTRPWLGSVCFEGSLSELHHLARAPADHLWYLTEAAAVRYATYC